MKSSDDEDELSLGNFFRFIVKCSFCLSGLSGLREDLHNSWFEDSHYDSHYF